MAKTGLLQKITYVFDFIVLWFLLIIPRNPYQWMEAEFNQGPVPEPFTLPEDPLRDIRLIITFTALLIITLMHVFNIVRNADTSTRLKNSLIVCALFGYWYWKFFYTVS